MRTSITLAALGLLAACGTPQERAAFREDPVNALAQEYGPACERAGYGRASREWRSCVLQSSTRDDLSRYALFYDRYMAWYLLR